MSLPRKIEFSSGDCMNLDITLSHIISAGLIEFRHNVTIDSEVFSIPGSIYGDGTLSEVECREEWIRVIDEMIYAFSSDAFELYRDKAHEERVESGRQLFAKHFRDLWW